MEMNVHSFIPYKIPENTCSIMHLIRLDCVISLCTYPRAMLLVAVQNFDHLVGNKTLQTTEKENGYRVLHIMNKYNVNIIMLVIIYRPVSNILHSTP